MIDDSVNLSNNKAHGAQSQGSFSVLGYGCVSPAEEEGTGHGQLQMTVPGCPARNALPLKTKGKSSKQRHKPPGKIQHRAGFNSSTSWVAAALRL